MSDLTKLLGAFTEVIEVVGGMITGDEKRDDLFESKDSGYKVVRQLDLGDLVVIGDTAHTVVGMHGDATRTTLSLKDSNPLTLPNDAKVRVA